MQTSKVEQRQKIEQLLDDLPEKRLTDVLNFLENLYLQQSQSGPPYQVVDQFEGIWQNYLIGEDEITEARREMWRNFGQDDK